MTQEELGIYPAQLSVGSSEVIIFAPWTPIAIYDPNLPFTDMALMPVTAFAWRKPDSIVIVAMSHQSRQ